MKKLQMTAWPKFCMAALLGASALLMASCAQDGFDDDESWEPSVTDPQMTSPSADQIEIIPSADGLSMTIKWPVVMGAGGYELALYDVSDEANPVQLLNRVVDGCSIENVPREEDMYYRLTIRTLGNSSVGSIDAASATPKEFTTTTETTATIPAGDLAEWFAENPVPESEEMLYYDLVAGGAYTLNSLLDFQGHKVTLRCKSKSNRATVTYGEEGGLASGNAFGLKYLNIECGSSSKSFFTLSDTPGVEVGEGSYYIITEPITFQYLTVNNLNTYFVYDGGSTGKKYCVKTMLVNNCVVKMSSNEKMATGAAFQVYDAQGFINDLTIQNSTFWNSTDNKQNYFIRYANSGRCTRAGFTSNSINIINCTLYNIAKAGQMCNHSGFDGQATANYNITSNIFVDCGNKQVARRIIGRDGGGTIIFNYNTYMFDGATTNADGTCIDQTGYDKEIGRAHV